MNVAYQPTKMMSVDIGTPLTAQSELTELPNREFLAYQMTTKNPSNSYTVIGYSNQTTIRNRELNERGYLNVTASLIYYLQRQPDNRWIPTHPLGTPSILELISLHSLFLIFDFNF